MADVNLDDLIKKDKEKNHGNKKHVWILICRSKGSLIKRVNSIRGNIKITIDQTIKLKNQEKKTTTTKISKQKLYTSALIIKIMTAKRIAKRIAITTIKKKRILSRIEFMNKRMNKINKSFSEL